MYNLDPNQLSYAVPSWPATSIAARTVPVLSGIRDPEEIIETIIAFARHGPYPYPHLCMSHEDPLICAYGSSASRLLERRARELPVDYDNQQLLNLKGQIKTEWRERVDKDLDRVSVNVQGGRRDISGAIERRVDDSVNLMMNEIVRKRTAVTQSPQAGPCRRSHKSRLAYKLIDRELCQIAKSYPASHAEVFTALEGRVPVPNAEPFRSARSWVRGYQRGKSAAHAWLSKRWACLGLSPFARGPKKLQ